MAENGKNGELPAAAPYDSDELLKRIVTVPGIFGGKPIIRGMRMAVEHVLGYLAAGSTVAELLEDFDFLEPEDIQACFEYAYRSVAGERFEIVQTRELVKQ